MTDSADAVADLVARVVSGDRRAVARALSIVERGDAATRLLVTQLQTTTNRPHVIGVTGVGGAGKSTLIASMTAEWRRRGETIGIVAIDPSSASTGGALLGDRVRMEELHGDRGVFVRSMAARGAQGGLAAATRDAITILSAAGFQRIVVETIGVGQDEIEVSRLVETTIVVEAPNMGDDVQALKAGLTEIADIFIVNKADLPGADRSVANLRSTLALGREPHGWSPTVLKTIAANGEGVAALLDAIDAHQSWLTENPDRPRRTHNPALDPETTRTIDHSRLSVTTDNAHVRIVENELRIEVDSWSSPHFQALLNRIVSAISGLPAEETSGIATRLLARQLVELPLKEWNKRHTR